MKKLLLLKAPFISLIRLSAMTLIVLFLLAGPGSGTISAQTTKIIVERIGDGTTALTNAAFPVTILEFLTSGTLARTYSFQGTGDSKQTDSGSATSNGYLNVYNGYIGVPGYNADLGTSSVAGTNTKVVSILDTTLVFLSRTLFPTEAPIPYTANNFRSVVPVASNIFYTTGTGNAPTGGVWYFNGTGFVQISSTETGQPTNTRNIEIYNNQLYISSATGSFLGISSVGAGLPVTGPQTAILVVDLGTGGSAYGFVMFDTNGDNILDRTYVADDRTNSTNGGINRFDFNGSAWVRTAAFRFDMANQKLSDATAGVVSIRGLAGTWNATTGATLYATTTEGSDNKLITFVDAPGQAWSTSTSFSILASAGANMVFRGVDVSVTGVISNVERTRSAGGTTSLRLYPNPASSKIVITDLEAGAGISIYNVAGELKMRTRAVGSHDEIDVTSLPAGIYFVRTDGGPGSAPGSAKVMITR